MLLKDVKADMLVLPELFATGYTFASEEEAQEMAETNHGQTADILKELSKSAGATMVGGFIEIDKDKIYMYLIIKIHE